MHINNDPNSNAMRWHCRAECTWLGLAASGRVVGFAPWARHGPRRRQGPNSRLPGAYLVPGSGRQIADISRIRCSISKQNTPREPWRCGGFRAVNRTLTRLWNKKIFGRQRPQTPYRACVRGRRHQIFQKSSVWRPARPERSGNVTINHIPRKQKDCGGLWCQNSSLKFWPPGTELWPARVQKKQKKCI